ncbi:MAG: outer membrane protein assembly factor BamD [Candidatus Azobacteroides sp.]|nr:outer membrane protein assembly factor BamD [Candidatus Azobacteroides sp.]
MKIKNLVYFFIFVLLTASCGEYNKVLKITDPELKYSYAKKYFSEKKYDKSAYILTELVPYFKGTDKAEESLYLLARSYYEQKDYITASQYFSTYFTTYPRGEYAELARFYNGYGYYLDSPQTELDQSTTYRALSELQTFLEYYPNSERQQEVLDIIFDLQEKLAKKALMNSQLYYNLGNYGGNNYISCIIVSQNALKDYPYSKYKEDFFILILRSKYQQALHSVKEKEQSRYREVVDEYYVYIGEFPDGKYRKEAEQILSKITSKLEIES